MYAAWDAFRGGNQWWLAIMTGDREYLDGLARIYCNLKPMFDETDDELRIRIFHSYIPADEA